MREPLKKNTRIKMDDGTIFRIIGKPIGSGGLSLIYPAVELINGKEEALPYAVKECYPETGFHRDMDTMEIRPVLMNIPGLEALDKQNQEMYETAKMQFLKEKELTAEAYIHTGRVIPVRKASIYSKLSLDGGSTFRPTGNVYSVMDDLTEKGDSVKTLLARKKLAVFQIEEALRITDQLLASLDEIHGHGLLHLDISEGNVFVQGSLKKETEQISLIDFGCARRRSVLPDGAFGSVFFDSSEKLFSTSGFTPPEMKKGGCVLESKADVYSAGCLLFRMLTGNYFERPSGTDEYLTNMHMENCACPAAYRKNLQHIMTSALAEDPAERFNTAGNPVKEMRAAVKKLLTDLTSYERLPEDLTPYSSVSFADERSVIHREKELEELGEMLEKGKNIVLMNGFGGVGKTSIARVLFSRFTSSGSYDSIGWLSYHGSLRDSMLSKMDLYEEEKDPDKRYKKICRRLRSDGSRKLLFIDNVDKDAAYSAIHGSMQDPLTDKDLRSIASWNNMTMVLTSRSDTLPGYTGCNYPIEYFKDTEACIDLFFFYYRDGKYYKDTDKRTDKVIVEKLVGRAGKHTYAIELLAKSAGNRSLPEYYSVIKESGFQFPGPDVYTEHSEKRSAMVKQLKILFNLNSRTKKEQKILWEFAILPAGEMLTTEEVINWFACDETDLANLTREGWLQADETKDHDQIKRVCYSMHMLVRETVQLSREYLQKSLAEPLVKMIVAGSFIGKQDRFYIRSRKLKIEQSVIKQFEHFFEAVSDQIFLSKAEYASACFNTGNDSNELMQRNEADRFYRSSLQIRRELEAQNPGVYKRVVAMSCNNLGNLVSADSRRRSEAETLYMEALKLYKELEEQNPSVYKGYVATICNNLGSLLKQDRRRSEAEALFLEALKLRRELEEQNPTKYKADVATTCNNLGTLLSQDNKRRNEAEALYMEALKLRRELEEQNPGVYKRYVATTCINLGSLLLRDSRRQSEAEALCLEALELYKELEEKNPGVYKGYVAGTYNNLGSLLMSDSGRQSEAESFYQEALKLRRELEEQNPGVYTEHLATTCYNLGNLLMSDSGRQSEAEVFYQDALKLYKELEEQNPNVYKSDVAETCYKLGSLVKQDSKRQSETEVFYQDALKLYKELEEQNSDVYKADVAKTCYNLGGLVKQDSKRQSETESFYLEALKLYKELEEKNPNVYKADVAKTCYYLGGVVKQDNLRRSEAESLYQEALKLGRELEEQNPGVYKGYVATTCYNLGSLLMRDSRRQSETETLFQEALKLHKELEEQNPGVYKGYIATSCYNLGSLLEHDRARLGEAEAFYQEALKLGRELEEQNPDVYLHDLATSCFNLALFEFNDIKNKEYSYMLFLEAYMLWSKYPIYKEFATKTREILVTYF